MPDVVTRGRTVPVPGGALELSWAEATDTGRRRETNQDAVLVKFPVFVVADGMGGHIGGEIASTRTVDRISEAVDKGDVTPAALEAALDLAVADIAGNPDATDEGTGTTLTGVFLDTGAEPHWVSFNVGDSRVYLVRDEAIMQITTDHSVVQELVDAGQISPDEAENHPYGNVITRAVGPSEGVVPDYVRVDIVDGDRLVVCSDGLTKELTDYGILQFLSTNPDPADAVNAMIAAALENGGRDNVTLIVINIAVAVDESSTPED